MARGCATPRPLAASSRILAILATAVPLRLLGASGQLGYGIPTQGFNTGLGTQA